MDRSDVQQVAEGVFRVGGRMVNWYLLRDGRDLTLVDAGYPAHAGDVESSIRLLGHEPSDVRALLITHAHVDHIGAAGPLHTQFGTPAYCSAAEVPHAHREFLEQVTPLRVLANAWRPGVLPWAVRAIRLGGTVSTAVPHAQPFPGVGPLDLPGRPVPVPTPGHTGGHTAFFLPAAGAVLTGDGLVTGHPTSRRAGPQLLPRFFDHDRAATAAALAPLAELDAELVLPGHGEPWRGPVADAVAAAGRGSGGWRAGGRP
jgi:glyoxylase-like metal-dependent hydrolase (beta-lactamase superfamily II)